MKEKTKDRIQQTVQSVKTAWRQHRPLLGQDRKTLTALDRTQILVWRGRKAVRALDYASREAVIRQHRFLSELIKENQDTEYGKKYGFREIHNAKGYEERVPLTEYDDYEPFITRMIGGEQNLLSARPVKYFAMTAGSIGVPKYVPVCEEELKKYLQCTIELAFGVADEYYRNTTGRGVPGGRGLSAVEMRMMETPSGVKHGVISSTLISAVRDSAPYLLSSPWEVVSPGGEEMDLKYLKARFALADKELVFMDSVFLTGLVDLMDYIRDNYEMLCRDIYHGRLNQHVKIPEGTRRSLERYLTPQKRRAKELLREFRQGFDTPIIPRIWPKMSWIGGIGTGSFFPYARRMYRYSGKSIPLNNLCYAASEAMIAAARHMGDESYVLIPDGGFYEFLPIDCEDESKTLHIDELEIGEDYRLIITNLSGFYRYRLHDVVRVTGYYNETPMIRFVYRENQLVSIAGEKTNEEDLRWAIEQFYLETRIHVSDYSIWADTNTSPGRYVLLVEPAQVVEKERLEYCRSVLEEKLMQANPSYAEMVRTGVLGKMELFFLQQQTYQFYRELQIMKGASSNQLKPVRVIDTPQKERFFFGLKETY